MTTQYTLSRRAQALTSSAIREILKVTERPEVISFAGGLPSPATFPVERMREATEKVLLDDSNIMAFIRKLRKKIEPDPDAPRYILTLWGIGYKFNDQL